MEWNEWIKNLGDACDAVHDNGQHDAKRIERVKSLLGKLVQHYPNELAAVLESADVIHDLGEADDEDN